MFSFVTNAERSLGRLLPPWWLILVAGVSWTLVALIVLRFDYSSVSAISLLFGFVALAAGAAEIGVTVMSMGLWKLLSALLAVAFIASGIISFIHPGDTFAALAAVISFFLIFSGTYEVITAISLRREIEVWWIQLIGGL